MRSTAENRRQHKRYKIENSVAVSSHGIFQLIDISRGGFRFKCPPDTPVPDSWNTDILASAASIEGITANRAWVSMAENGNNKRLPTVVGAKFGRLTRVQNTLLAQIIEAISQGEDIEH